MQKRLTEQGLKYLETGQLDKAAQILTLLVHSFPDNANAQHMLGIIELERGNFDVAKNLVDEISLIKPHKKPIIGVELDFNIGYVFSISSEGQLVISEFNYQTNIKTLNVSKSCLTALLYDEFANLLILADNLGSLYFYNVSNPINPITILPFAFVLISRAKGCVLFGGVASAISGNKIVFLPILF